MRKKENVKIEKRGDEKLGYNEEKERKVQRVVKERGIDRLEKPER